MTITLSCVARSSPILTSVTRQSLNSPRRSVRDSRIFIQRMPSCVLYPVYQRPPLKVIIAETGGDMSRFPTSGHLCAWAGVAPASYESAGKRRPAGTRHGAPWLKRTLIEAARAAARTKGTYYSAQYARIAKRTGTQQGSSRCRTLHARYDMASTHQWHLLCGPRSRLLRSSSRPSYPGQETR